jgi:hypothetical protein
LNRFLGSLKVKKIGLGVNRMGPEQEVHRCWGKGEGGGTEGQVWVRGTGYKGGAKGRHWRNHRVLWAELTELVGQQGKGVGDQGDWAKFAQTTRNEYIRGEC